MVTVVLFARLREAAGRDRIDLPLDEAAPAAVLLQSLRAELPALAAWLAPGRVLVAVNQELVDAERSMVRPGDEVALMPPFSGGGDAGVRIQAEDFSIDAELTRLRAVSGRIGGICVFLGTARDLSDGRAVRRLQYEHYDGMAQRCLEQLRTQALARFGIIDLTLVHRVGWIATGGQIVLVAAAAEHRPAAFDACRWCIDQLKQTVPIWKREETADGAVWVENRP